MKLIALLLLLLTFSSTQQACAAGCLMCDSSSNCIVPDLSQNYVLSNNTAVASTLTNCFYLNADGTCASCDAQYYLDSTTSKCVAVPTASLITNCSYYNTATSCSLCAAGFYLSSNVCTAVTTTVSNCAAYTDATTCSSCSSGYMLSLDSSSCVSTSSVSDCSGYTYVTCGSCAGNYFLNRNNYLSENLMSTTSTDQTNLAVYARNVINSTSYFGEDVCASTANTNCTTFATDSTACTQCNTSYYLDTSGVCNAYPTMPILNCSVYTAAAVCATCSSGYLLQSNLCVAITTSALIANCSTYNNSVSTVTCTACTSTYYLSSNACTLRSNSASISNCATYTVTADTCAICSTGFQLSSDKLQCYANIANCSVYSIPAKNSTLQCSTCASTYYLVAATANVQSSCATGSVTNCATYSNSGTTCSTCVNGFYLNSTANTCNAQPAISQCTAYSTAQGGCATCNPNNSFLVSIYNMCQNVATTIANCIAYAGTVASSTCSTCASGFALAYDGSSCTAISIANCTEAAYNVNSVQVCNSCNSGYFISYTNTACVSALTYNSNQCNSSNDSTANAFYARQYGCNTCNSNAIPVKFTNQFVCVTPTEGLQLTIGTALTVTNCIKYDSSGNCVQCDPTSSNFLLDRATTPYSCGASCSFTGGSYYKYDIDSTTLQITGYNLCVTNGSVNNCAIFAPNLYITSGFTSPTSYAGICISCATGSFPVLDPNTTAYSNADFTTTLATTSSFLLSDYIRSPSAYKPQVTCVATSGKTFVGASTTGIANCTYYKLTSASDYSCIKCNEGYTGIPNSSGYIATCAVDSTCITTTKYYGLDSMIANLASCKMCSDAAGSIARIPVIAYTATSTTNPTFSTFVEYIYSSTNSGTSFDSPTAGSPALPSVTCQDPRTGPTSAVAWAYLYSTSSTYAYCGIIGIVGNNGADNSTADATKIGNYCAACAPGYYPVTINSTYAYVKNTCVAVPNCDASNNNLFNGCATCASGYVLEYRSTNPASDINFSNCLLKPTGTLTNCYAASVSSTAGTAVSTCTVCNSGYNLNNDGICEALTPEHCTAGAFSVNATTQAYNIRWSLYINNNAPGCNQCASGYVAVANNGSTNVCVTSDYVQNTVSTLNTTSSAYVEHCSLYSALSTVPLKCATCASGYILNYSSTSSLDATICYPATSANFANCSLASSATACYQCSSPAYSLLSTGACQLGANNNCATYNYYNDGSNIATAVCTGCSSGYALNASAVCVVGAITNCSDYSSETTCNTCATGYTVYSNSGNGNGPQGTDLPDFCFVTPTAFGCGEFGIASSGEYYCISCAANTTQIAISTPANSATVNNALSACVTFSAVSNCAEYNSGSIANSSYTCESCNSGYYLSNNTCVARTSITNCSIYDSDADTCDTCATGTYLSANSKTCTANPTGVYKCSTYSNATTCTSCLTGYYLSSNACPAVTSTIANCSVYSGAATCSACASNYVLSSNACVTPTATNCLTYTSSTACASCNNGYVLTATTTTSNSTTTTVTNCVAATGKANCATVNYTSPYNCTSCNSGYYLNSGACTAATTTIAHCTNYASATTCSQCDADYALGTDATSCTTNSNIASYSDSNCDDSQIASSPSCSRCSAGSYFVDGACTGTCSVTGCLACAPTSTSTCYICNTGYYQDSTGACNAVSSDISSTGIFGVLSAIVLVFAVMIK